jgi:predicted deacetylase
MFALRDDDLNFYYSPSMIEEYYKFIWDICPISMSVVPFIKGNWLKLVNEAERMGPGVESSEYLNELLSNNEIFPIHKNLELVEFIKEQMALNRIYLTIHAIHHRNEDRVIPQFKTNFGSGAEFYTNRDLTADLENAISYLEQIFKQKIDVFTPPQNQINSLGFRAVLNNDLAICADLPSIKRFNTLKLFGIKHYSKYFLYKLKNRKSLYPFVIKNGSLSIVAHQRLQPGIDINKIKKEIDLAHENNGVFVLSTHSYGFNYKMKKGNQNMGEALIDIIQYAKEKPGIDFVNLKQIFK